MTIYISLVVLYHKITDNTKSLTNYLTPYIPMAEARGFTAHFGNTFKSTLHLPIMLIYYELIE